MSSIANKTKEGTGKSVEPGARKMRRAKNEPERLRRGYAHTSYRDPVPFTSGQRRSRSFDPAEQTKRRRDRRAKRQKAMRELRLKLRMERDAENSGLNDERVEKLEEILTALFKREGESAPNRALAERLGCVRSQLSRWIHGWARVPDKYADAIDALHRKLVTREERK